MGDSVPGAGLQADPATLREFLRIAGAPISDDGPLPEEVKRGVRRAQGSRPPGEACLPLHALAQAGIPTLVASGDHVRVIERMCDAVAAALRCTPRDHAGSGTFVAAAPEFPAGLERFLLEAR